ncbi:hypothetical protein KM043_016501 [Ampulex compressa]|nr:hypothetical protein KM043_016501 [Ampulex compressa]
MSNYASDDDIISPVIKQRRLQAFSSSSEDVVDENIEFGNESNRSKAYEIESEKENQNPNVEWNISGRNRQPFEFSVNDGQQEITPSKFRYKCLFYIKKV